MKIALLNLPLDLNYGGNLQRYALATTLRRMGHEVEHIQLIEQGYNLLPLRKRYFVYLKRILFEFIGKNTLPVLYESHRRKGYSNVKDFYKKYVPHTEKKFTAYHDLLSYDWGKFDAFIVGSDQVWRPDMTKKFGIATYFFGFISKLSRKKIAYAVSFGKDHIVLPQGKIQELKSFYNDFYCVSVREKSALKILEDNGMTQPSPQLVLDPTLLLNREDYISIVKKEIPKFNEKDYLLTYFINEDLRNDETINKIAFNNHLSIVNITIASAYNVPIPLWLAYFMNAKYIITDSYHGLLFSIIFNKPFKIIYNIHGGTSRIQSVLKMFEIQNVVTIDWDKVDNLKDYYKKISLDFLQKSLEE